MDPFSFATGVITGVACLKIFQTCLPFVTNSIKHLNLIERFTGVHSRIEHLEQIIKKLETTGPATNGKYCYLNKLRDGLTIVNSNDTENSLCPSSLRPRT
jgi:hypothetical protein